MVRSAAELIRTKGVSGTGMREVVAVAGAPRGSLQHYFPGGKDQLVAEALSWMGGVAARRVARVMASLDPPTPLGLLQGTIGLWREEFQSHGFDGGCPLVGAGADVAATNDALRTVISEAFDGWRDSFVAAFVQMDVPPERAAALAVVVLSALEGAILLARIHQDNGPLDAVGVELGPLLDAAVSTGREH